MKRAALWSAVLILGVFAEAAWAQSTGNLTQQMALGKAYLNNNEFMKAINTYNAVLDVHPDYAQAYNARGLVYFKMGATDEAANDFQTALSINPHYDEAQANLKKLESTGPGAAFPSTHPQSGAMIVYDTPIPDYPQTGRQRPGGSLPQGGSEVVVYADPSAAQLGGMQTGYQTIADGRAVINMSGAQVYSNPTPPVQYNNAMPILYNQPVQFSAAGYYNPAPARPVQYTVPAPPRSSYVADSSGRNERTVSIPVGGLADASGSLAGAGNPATQAAAKAAVNAMVIAGIDYTKQGYYDKAMYLYNQALRADPNSAIAYNNRGVVYAKLGNYASALSDFNSALGLDPNYADARANRDQLFRTVGR
jgi:tetratricopeptide (TPR) repeat protein